MEANGWGEQTARWQGRSRREGLKKRRKRRGRPNKKNRRRRNGWTKENQSSPRAPLYCVKCIVIFSPQIFFLVILLVFFFSIFFSNNARLRKSRNFVGLRELLELHSSCLHSRNDRAGKSRNDVEFEDVMSPKSSFFFLLGEAVRVDGDGRNSVTFGSWKPTGNSVNRCAPCAPSALRLLFSILPSSECCNRWFLRTPVAIQPPSKQLTKTR